MDNKSVAKILQELGVMIELSGGNPFSARAHTNGARIVESLTEPVKSIVETGKLSEIKGIGKGLAKKITQLINTGTIDEYVQMKEKLPDGLFDILKLPGMGPKKVRAVYKKLEITSIGELEYACNENRLADLNGFGEKSQANVLSGIQFLKVSRERHLFHEAKHAAHNLLEIVLKFPHIKQVSIAGSIRRHKETIKDIDLIAVVENEHRESTMEQFTSLPDVDSVIGKGETKSSVRLASGFQADLRLVSENAYPFMLHHFTGSKEHNTAMRSRAKAFGLKMNEYGLYKNGASVSCKDEKDVFKALDLEYIEPELRENFGEIEAASKNDLPQLVTPGDIKGILHVHTSYSDGTKSIEEMAAACIGLGYEYLGICDHSKSAFYANGLSEDRIKQQHEEIDKLNDKYPNFKIFKGIESDILIDGSLDYPDKILETFDLVVASVHSKLKMTEDEATKRLEKVMNNPFTTILGHPTGRLLLAREGFPVNMQYIIDLAKKNGIVIEINANPHRFDLDWRHCKYAKEKGVMIAVNPDAHNIEGIKDVDYGIGIARKGWLEKQDILNTMGAAEIHLFFQSKRSSK